MGVRSSTGRDSHGCPGCERQRRAAIIWWRFLEKSYFDEPGRLLPRDNWAFARVENEKFVPGPSSVISGDELTPGHIYELICQGAKPGLAGLGEAAVSDFVSWLKYGGVASPLRDYPEILSSHVFGYGYSQSGRFLRDFLYWVFHADRAARYSTASSSPAQGQGGEASIIAMRCLERRSPSRGSLPLHRRHRGRSRHRRPDTTPGELP